MDKVLYFDCETTGLSPVNNDIIQLAGLIEFKGVVVDEFNFKIQPFSYENISEKALEVSGTTIEVLKTYLEPRKAYQQIINKFSEYINKFDKEDKFTPVGFNIGFDLEFLNQFFIKNGDKYFGSWCNWRKVDPLAVLYYLDYAKKLNLDLPNFKLETVCQKLGIEIQAHDAMSDIKATRELSLKLIDYLED